MSEFYFNTRGEPFRRYVPYNMAVENPFKMCGAITVAPIEDFYSDRVRNLNLRDVNGELIKDDVYYKRLERYQKEMQDNVDLQKKLAVLERENRKKWPKREKVPVKDYRVPGYTYRYDPQLGMVSYKNRWPSHSVERTVVMENRTNNTRRGRFKRMYNPATGTFQRFVGGKFFKDVK